MSDKPCGICFKEAKSCLYVCPRCSIQYCSAECYKSPNHRSCSETFYRDSVREEVKIREAEKEKRPNVIIEAIKKLEKSHAKDFSNGIDFDEDFQPEFDEEEDETEDLSYLNMDLRKLDLESLDETELDAQLKALGIDSSNSQNLLAALNQREREALEELLNNEEIPVEVIKEEIKPTIYKYSQPFPAKPTAPLSKRTVIEEI